MLAGGLAWPEESLPHFEVYRGGEVTVQEAVMASQWLGLKHVIASHYSDPAWVLRVRFSRPKGKRVPELSLRPAAKRLSDLLGTEVGADAFIGKPFNELELMSVVRNLIQLKAREHEVEDLNRLLVEKTRWSSVRVTELELLKSLPRKFSDPCSRRSSQRSTKLTEPPTSPNLIC